MRIIIKWIITAMMPLIICFAPFAYSTGSVHFSTGAFEGGELALIGVNFTPYQSVEVEITDPLNGTLSYIENADENGGIQITFIAGIAGTYKAVVASGSDTEISADTTVQGEQ